MIPSVLDERTRLEKEPELYFTGFDLSSWRFERDPEGPVGAEGSDRGQSVRRSELEVALSARTLFMDLIGHRNAVCSSQRQGTTPPRKRIKALTPPCHSATIVRFAHGMKSTTPAIVSLGLLGLALSAHAEIHTIHFDNRWVKKRISSACANPGFVSQMWLRHGETGLGSLSTLVCAFNSALAFSAHPRLERGHLVYWSGLHVQWPHKCSSVSLASTFDSFVGL